MSSIPWPDVVVSRWSIWLRIVTQDSTLIQVQMHASSQQSSV